MKKTQFILLSLMTLFISTSAAAETIKVSKTSLLVDTFISPDAVPSSFQFGPYFTYNNCAGTVQQLASGNVGIGWNVYYKLPFELTDKFDMGFDVCVDTNVALELESYIESWYTTNSLFGIWFDWNVTPKIKIRPEIDYGVVVNFISSEARGMDGYYIDQMIRGGVSLMWTPARLASVYGGLNYSFVPEASTFVHYIGIKAGVLLRPYVNKSK